MFCPPYEPFWLSKHSKTTWTVLRQLTVWIQTLDLENLVVDLFSNNQMNASDQLNWNGADWVVLIRHTIPALRRIPFEFAAVVYRAPFGDSREHSSRVLKNSKKYKCISPQTIYAHRRQANWLKCLHYSTFNEALTQAIRTGGWVSHAQALSWKCEMENAMICDRIAIRLPAGQVRHRQN